MEETNIVSADTSNGESTQTLNGSQSTETVDVAALQKKLTETEQANRQLFERAKRAEGNVLIDGKWVKAPKETPAETEQPRKTGELEKIEKLFLKTENITKEHELALFNKWKQDTGRDAEAITSNTIFQAELAQLRKEKQAESDALVATPTSGNRASGTPANSEDFWWNKYQAAGKLPEGMPAGMAEKLVNRRYQQEGTRAPRF